MIDFFLRCYNISKLLKGLKCGSYFTTKVALLATITYIEIVAMAATLQHLYFALWDIMVIIDVKPIMAMIVVITVIYIMSVIVILDAT